MTRNNPNGSPLDDEEFDPLADDAPSRYGDLTPRGGAGLWTVPATTSAPQRRR